MEKSTTRSVVLLCMIVASVGLMAELYAAELHVDQKHPAAKDDNPGTLEAPFKTIQAALDKAQAGDSVEVRAGVYRESVKFKHSGNSGGAAWDDRQDSKWITLEAYQNDRVILDGSLPIPTGDWKLVDGCANTYVAPFEKKGHPVFQKLLQLVFAADVMLPPALKEHHDETHPGLPLVPAMPGDKTSDEGWYYDAGQKQLFVNCGGRAPGKDVEVAAAPLDMGVDMTCQSYVRVKGLEVRRFNQRGIWADYGSEFTVEDNFVHHCGTGIWSGKSSGGIIRGNTVADILTIAMIVGGSRGTIIENNLIRHVHLNPFKGDGGLSGDYYCAAIMCNSSFGLVVRNNIIAESDDGGPWPDCGSTGISLYGNTIYGLSRDGFYIEALAYGTVLQWNTVFDNRRGIAFRQNCANTALENYVFNNRGSGLDIGSCDSTGVKGNTMIYNWVIGNGVGTAFGPDKAKAPAHAFDHNVYSRNGRLFQYGDKQYKDLKSVRDNVGVEMHGEEVADFDPTPLGLVTFRVSDTKKSWKPVPMFGNPDAQRPDIQTPYGELYFWRRGTFLRMEPSGWHDAGFGGIGGWVRGQASGCVRQLLAEFIPFVASKKDCQVDSNADPSACWTNGVCLQVCAIPGKSVSAEGLGYWSPKLPTTDGAQIDLSLWIRAKDVKSAGEHGGVYVLAEFCDETSQNVKRQYLAGANDGEKVVGGEWVAGTYEYKKLTGLVTAPKGARWFKMGFGIRNCSGWAAFNGFDISTRPGEKTKEVEVVLPITAKQYAWTPCDLTGLLNRPLADEIDGDGKGGWTDQGATMDLRNLYAGDYTYNNVAFHVAQGNACFVMKNKQRPSDNLPANGKVELKGKAAVLAFLHSGGWIANNVRHATYVIHYADGQKVEIPLIGGKNIFDWTSGPTVLEGLKYNPELGFTQHAVTVPVPKFVSGYVWMTLWKNPRPEVEIQALEAIGANEGIPGLMAVSRGVAR